MGKHRTQEEFISEAKKFMEINMTTQKLYLLE